MEIRNGKKPLAAKAAHKPSPLNMDDIFGNTLGLDPEIVKEIESKGLAYRFINAVKLKEFGGHHARGWVPYKCDKIKSSSEDIFGSNPDGYIRRGDVVLAVRSKELNERHKAYLKQEASKRKDPQASHAEELRKMAKAANVEMDIHEGYDD